MGDGASNTSGDSISSSLKNSSSELSSCVGRDSLSAMPFNTSISLSLSTRLANAVRFSLSLLLVKASTNTSVIRCIPSSSDTVLLKGRDRDLFATRYRFLVSCCPLAMVERISFFSIPLILMGILALSACFNDAVVAMVLNES